MLCPRPTHNRAKSLISQINLVETCFLVFFRNDDDNDDLAVQCNRDVPSLGCVSFVNKHLGALPSLVQDWCHQTILKRWWPKDHFTFHETDESELCGTRCLTPSESRVSASQPLILFRRGARGNSDEPTSALLKNRTRVLLPRSNASIEIFLAYI